MSRRIIGVLGGLTSAALVATAIQVPAAAAPPEDPHQQGQLNGNKYGNKHDRPDPLEQKRRAKKKRAIDLVLSGKRQVQSRGGSESVKVGEDEWVQWETETNDRLFSILVEFTDVAGDDLPGPTHNQIPEPGAEDNSTYWVEDFNRDHYLDMFFNGMPEQNGESFQNIYKEMSSGRYSVTGDVSNWVQVDKPEAAYGTTESHQDMTYFIDDTAEAWFTAQREAGKNPKEIRDYLSSFDRWDRYDHDADGNFDEPDGYIDHFQAIHAGEGEEAGAPEWAIWSHRWAVNQNGFHPDGIGPRGAEFGGIEIGNTGFWIRDYTTEPENGGLGVFVHEYAHDLGLPDLYDTAGGENGTGFWTLMSSGSWLGHGEGAIGTTPNHMGAWEKLMLGWLDFDVASSTETTEHILGPSFRDTEGRAEAVIVELPDKTTQIDLGDAAEGSDFFYSGRGDERTATVTSPPFTVPQGGQLTAQARYAIEADWDYAYAEVSTDSGATWTPLATNLSSTTNPNGSNDGQGITGSSEGAWVPLTADLAAFAGQDVQVRFRMENDAAVNEVGFMVDAISVGNALSEGAEDGAADWTMDKFVIAEEGIYKRKDAHYYIAENRRYMGYDATLQTGPYNFGWSQSAPDKVEHFPYADGMLVWYWDTSFSDNNTSAHPGHGEVLPVDARPEALSWQGKKDIARNRIQSYDATFGTPSDAITLHQEDGRRVKTLDVPAGEPVMVFDDSDPMAYYDPANPGGSVIVGGTDTQIEVVEVAENGTMTIEVR